MCIYSVILWTSLTSIGNDEEDRWSFKRSMKAVTLIAIVQNIYQVVFLTVQTTNITFNLLENVRIIGSFPFIFGPRLYLFLFAICLTIGETSIE